MNILDLIPRSAMAALIAILVVTSLKLHWDKNGLIVDVQVGKTQIAQLKEAHAATVATAATQLAANEKYHRAQEQTLQATFDEERKKSYETHTRVAAERDALLVRLQSAADSNPTFRLSGPSAASYGQATGSSDKPQLSDTLTGLVDEAARAEEIREALLGCYRKYDNVRDLLNTKPQE